jgi:hypothetical protein
MTSSRKIPKEGTCSLCGGHYDDYGHNPAPLGIVPAFQRSPYGGLKSARARCCTECNSQIVIPARLRRLANDRSQREGVQ